MTACVNLAQSPESERSRDYFSGFYGTLTFRLGYKFDANNNQKLRLMFACKFDVTKLNLPL